MNIAVAPGLSGKQIMIVEDDATLAGVLKAALEARACAVTVCSSADSVLDELAVHRPDCLILDLIIPGTSGIELLRMLRERNHTFSVIAMSGAGTIATAVEAMKLGACEYLEKPFKIDDFLALVSRNTRSGTVAVAGHEPVQGLALLTGREHEVLAQIAQGASSKEAGRNLGISPRTVDVHRAHIKEKLKVRRAVDLVRLVYSTDQIPARLKG
jgi:FixJ family two-component response regulator